MMMMLTVMNMVIMMTMIFHIPPDHLECAFLGGSSPNMQTMRLRCRRGRRLLNRKRRNPFWPFAFWQKKTFSGDVLAQRGPPLLGSKKVLQRHLQMTPREKLSSDTILCKAKIAVSISLHISYEDDDDHLGAARHCMRIVPPLPGRNLTTMRRVKKSQQCDRGTGYDHHDFYKIWRW